MLKPFQCSFTLIRFVCMAVHCSVFIWVNSFMCALRDEQRTKYWRGFFSVLWYVNIIHSLALNWCFKLVFIFSSLVKAENSATKTYKLHIISIRIDWYCWLNVWIEFDNNSQIEDIAVRSKHFTWNFFFFQKSCVVLLLLLEFCVQNIIFDFLQVHSMCELSYSKTKRKLRNAVDRC